MPQSGNKTDLRHQIAAMEDPRYRQKVPKPNRKKISDPRSVRTPTNPYQLPQHGMMPGMAQMPGMSPYEQQQSYPGQPPPPPQAWGQQQQQWGTTGVAAHMQAQTGYAQQQPRMRKHSHISSCYCSGPNCIDVKAGSVCEDVAKLLELSCCVTAGQTKQVLNTFLQKRGTLSYGTQNPAVCTQHVYISPNKPIWAEITRFIRKARTNILIRYFYSEASLRQTEM